MQTNAHTGTTIDEVAAGIYRINTPLRIDSIPGGFNLSQYLIVDDEPMIFHTGWRRWLRLRKGILRIGTDDAVNLAAFLRQRTVR